MSAAFPAPEESLEVEPVFVDSLLQESSDAFVLIDCREEDEHAYCRIAGDVLVPLSRFVGSIGAVLPDPEVPLVVYCHHGMRSAQAASFLRAKGHPCAFSLRGGIEAWSVEVDPTVPRY